jgi:release factor glutamine methyltransferase
MMLKELLKQATKQLQPRKITCSADTDIGRLEAEVLLAHVLKKNRVWLLAHPEAEVMSAQSRVFERFVKRRMKHEPIAHILGEKEFYGRTFVVNKHTLIPRPETELMIDVVKTTVEPDPHLHGDNSGNRTIVWDVGTGSGTIAVTLAKELPKATILASDVSARALAVAKKNAKRLGADVTFLKSNLLQPNTYRWMQKHPGADVVIAANLPYLPNSDKKKLDLDVVKFEPSSALFSGADGLHLIRRFMGQLSRHLPEWNFRRAILLFEFDPPQVKTIRQLAEKFFPRAEISIHQDLAGRDRVIEIKMSS